MAYNADKMSVLSREVADKIKQRLKGKNAIWHLLVIPDRAEDHDSILLLAIQQLQHSGSQAAARSGCIALHPAPWQFEEGTYMLAEHHSFCAAPCRCWMAAIQVCSTSVHWRAAG